MKKFLNLLLVLALLVVLPFGVNAAVSYKAVEDANKTAMDSSTEGDVKTATYGFYINVLEDAIPANQDIVVEFTVGSAITEFTCGKVDGGNVTQSKKEGTDNTYVCTYTNDGELTGSKVQIGTWTIKYSAGSAEKDCSVNYSLGDGSGIVNPPTGSTISYVVVGLGVLAAAAAFAVSRKKSKLYNL